MIRGRMTWMGEGRGGKYYLANVGTEEDNNNAVYRHWEDNNGEIT